MRIAHYVSTDGQLYHGKDEFIVLLEDGENPDDYLRSGFELNRIYETDIDTGSLPASRELIAA